MNMNMQPVKSSNINAIGYDATSNKLRVEFDGGSTYEYHDVPPDVHKELVSAPSVGSYHAKNIRGQYSHRKVI